MRVFVLGGDPHFYVERKEKKGYKVNKMSILRKFSEKNSLINAFS